MLIGGELVASESAAWDDSINPANEEVIGRVPAGTPRDVDRAVAAAQAASPLWNDRPPQERAEVLLGFSQKMLDRAGEILVLRWPILETRSRPCTATFALPSRD